MNSTKHVSQKDIRTIKGKGVSLRAKQAQRECRRVAVPILHPDCTGEGGQIHDPAAMNPGKRPGAHYTVG